MAATAAAYQYAFMTREGDRELEDVSLKRLISEHQWLPWTGKTTGLQKIMAGDKAEDRRLWQKISFPSLCALKCTVFFLVTLVYPPGEDPTGPTPRPYLLEFKGVSSDIRVLVRPTFCLKIFGFTLASTTTDGLFHLRWRPNRNPTT